MELYFYKLHGLGNDMIVVDGRGGTLPERELARIARRLCNRRTGKVSILPSLSLLLRKITQLHFQLIYHCV